MCRFHCCLAAHQRTRKKDSAEPSFPILWTPPHPPGVIRCGGKMYAAAADRDIGSLYPVQIDNPHFRIWFGCFVFGLGLLAFQKITLGLCLSFFIGGGMDCSFLRLRGVLAKSFVGFALTAVGAIVLVENGMGYLLFSSLNRTNVFYNMVLPSLFGEMGLQRAKLAPFRGQR